MEFAVTLYNICRSFPRPFVKKEKKIWDFYQNHGNKEPAAPPAPTKRKKKANPDSLEKKEELVTAETDQTPEQNQEEIAAKVARKLNRIPFYPKDWKDSFGLSVEEHKKALETNLTDGYIEFSATR